LLRIPNWNYRTLFPLLNTPAYKLVRDVAFLGNEEQFLLVNSKRMSTNSQITRIGLTTAMSIYSGTPPALVNSLPKNDLSQQSIELTDFSRGIAMAALDWMKHIVSLMKRN